MLNLLKKAFNTIYEQVTGKLHTLFHRSQIDENTLAELEKILIESDTGIHTTRSLISDLRKKAAHGALKTGADLESALQKSLTNILSQHNYDPHASVYLLVGINGSGKTTFAAKLANDLQHKGKKVLLVAADTFRAAATAQLKTWADSIGADLIAGTPDQDPASVVFNGCEAYKKGLYDTLIIDTAGRLQTKVNLMKELEKMRKILTKLLPDSKIATLLTIDAMLGQNSFDQAKLFKESTDVSGIVLTKFDGTGKGGIVFSICQQLQIPIAYLSYGEKVDQIAIFNKEYYLKELMGRDISNA
jgi:fused signal recognition particle receptor